MATERILMSAGDTISLYRQQQAPTPGNAVEFRIVEVLEQEQGSSCVCYRAYQNGCEGRLKEFYPLTLAEAGDPPVTMDRSEDLQLIQPPQRSDLNRIFRSKAQQFCQPLILLRTLKQQYPDIGTFCLPVEIYQGYRFADGAECSADAVPVKSSLYLWYRDMPSYRTFQQYINDIHSNPDRNPRKAVYTILETVRALAVCIQCLHDAGMVHGDIKPGNFGCMERQGVFMASAISIFDWDTLTKIGDCHKTGTPGFYDPSLLEDGVCMSPATDLYSIGATLYHALVLPDQPEESRYDPNRFRYLEQDLKDSRLLKADPVTDNWKFRNCLVRILQKCLSPNCDQRYRKCQELADSDDLAYAAGFVLPTSAEAGLRTERRTFEQNISALNQFNEADAVFAIQYQLFNHPLYAHAQTLSGPDRKVIRLLVLGFGVYGQCFTNYALQLSQLPGYTLEVHIASNHIDEEKNRYLGSRPGMKDFFVIDGQRCTGTPYGQISFCHADFTDDRDRNRKELCRLLEDFDATYIAVAMQDTLRRIETARLADSLHPGCEICYIHEDPNILVQASESSVSPIATWRKKRNYPKQPLIEQMAFNVHLSWDLGAGHSVNYADSRKYFLKPNNYNSSVCCVLSMKYKLHAMNIDLSDLREAKLVEAADAAAEKLRNADKSSGSWYAELIQSEHRRWIVEKITDGWKCRVNLTGITTENNKKEKEKLHPCIVRSEPNFFLEELFGNPAVSESARIKWNRENPDDEKLDPLDRLSVRLHRQILANAGKVRANGSLQGEAYRKTQALLADYPKALMDFQNYIGCLEQFWATSAQTGCIVDPSRYEALRTAFDRRLKQMRTGLRKGGQFTRKADLHPDLTVPRTAPLSEQDLDQVQAFFHQLTQENQSVVDSFRFRDYKSTDTDLVRMIPFLLTYRSDLHLFVPLMTGSADARFSNVAAATVINPERILYACRISHCWGTSCGDVLSTVQSIMTYLSDKQLQARVTLLVLYEDRDVSEIEVHKLRDDLNSMYPSSSKFSCCLLPVRNGASVLEVLKKKLNSGPRIDLYEKNHSSNLSGILEGGGIYQDPNLAVFSFDSRSRRFDTNRNCHWLSWIPAGWQSLTIRDLFSFQDASATEKRILELSDECPQLWQVHKNNRRLWEKMCRLLARHAEKEDTIACFAVDLDETDPICETKFIVPIETRDGYRKVLGSLKQKRIIGPNSGVELRTARTCLVRIVCAKKNQPAAFQLSACPNRFLLPEDLTIQRRTDQMIVNSGSLMVAGLRYTDDLTDPGEQNQLTELLHRLQKLMLISGLQFDSENRVSFFYSSRLVKELLTVPEQILELYLYFRLSSAVSHSRTNQCAGFQDVISGYEVRQAGFSSSRKHTCILLSGFRSVLIRWVSGALSDEKLEDASCDLKFQCENFGINSLPVLILDPGSESDWKSEELEDLRNSMKKIGIHLIFDADEIDVIDETIRRILEEN